MKIRIINDKCTQCMLCVKDCAASVWKEDIIARYLDPMPYYMDTRLMDMPRFTKQPQH